MGREVPPSEWVAVLDNCLRRIRAWCVPPNWSVRDWFEEMGAHGAAAALQAVRDYESSRGVPFSAFMHQRVMASALTRYRQEWTYVARCVCEATVKDEHGSITEDSFYPTMIHEWLRCALVRLPEPDRRLIEQLFWEGRTEAEIAKQLEISHQAVSKRKRAILEDLHRWLDMSKKNFKK